MSFVLYKRFEVSELFFSNKTQVSKSEYHVPYQERIQGLKSDANTAGDIFESGYNSIPSV